MSRTKTKTPITNPIEKILETFKKEYDNLIDRPLYRKGFKIVRANFQESLGNLACTIKSYKDLSEETFLRQIGYYKGNSYNITEVDPFYVIDIVRRIYQHYVIHDPEWEFLSSSTRFTKELVCTSMFSRYVLEGYGFYTYGNVPINGDKAKLLLSFPSSLSLLSYVQTSKPYVKIDCSDIPNKYYRNMLLKYISTLDASLAMHTRHGYIAEMLKLLFMVKTMPGAPNHDLRSLTSFEADQIRTMILQKPVSNFTKGRMLSTSKLFLEWAEDNEEFKIEAIAWSFFRSPQKFLNSTDIKSVPKEDVEKIAEYLVEEGQRKPVYELSFAILNILLQTPFRMSEIVRLERDCLIDTGKQGVYVLRHKAKTSGGDYEDRTIPHSTYALIKHIVSRTEEYVDRCSNEGLSRCLFLYPNCKTRGVKVMDKHSFNKCIGMACTKLQLPKYSYSNFRKSYMTFTYLESTKRNDGEYFLKTNTYHKSKRITLAHYVDKSAVLMNSNFGYSLGSEEELLEYENSVRDSKEGCIDERRKVLDGAGYCDSKECIGMITCLGCKHLILTESSIPAIRRVLSEMEDRILKCEIPHEREGLIDIRAAYARCLDQINKHISKSYENN